MIPSNRSIKSKSQKILEVMRKELKKLAPKGASQRKLFTYNPLVPSPDHIRKQIDFEDHQKDKRSSPLSKFIENKIDKNRHWRSPIKFETFKRMATISPLRIPLSPMQKNNEYTTSEPNRKSSQLITDKNQAFLEKLPEKLANGMIGVSKDPKTLEYMPKAIKNYTKQLTKIVNGLETLIVKNKGDNKE